MMFLITKCTAPDVRDIYRLTTSLLSKYQLFVFSFDILCSSVLTDLKRYVDVSPSMPVLSPICTRLSYIKGMTTDFFFYLCTS